MEEFKVAFTEVYKQNLFIDTNHVDYKWLKKHYNDPNVSDGEREWVDFDDSIINTAMGKYQLKQFAPNVLPENKLETIALVGNAKKKDFDVEKLVLCRFLYDGPGTYEVVGMVNKNDTEFNKDGVLVLKQKKL